MNLVSRCVYAPISERQQTRHPMLPFSGHFQQLSNWCQISKGRMTPRGPVAPFKILLYTPYCKNSGLFSLPPKLQATPPCQCLRGHSNTSNQAFVVTPYHPWKRHCRVSQRNQGWLSYHARPISAAPPPDRDDPTKILFMSSSYLRDPLPTNKPSVYDLELPIPNLALEPRVLGSVQRRWYILTAWLYWQMWSLWRHASPFGCMMTLHVLCTPLDSLQTAGGQVGVSQLPSLELLPTEHFGEKYLWEECSPTHNAMYSTARLDITIPVCKLPSELCSSMLVASVVSASWVMLQVAATRGPSVHGIL